MLLVTNNALGSQKRYWILRRGCVKMTQPLLMI